MTDIPALIARVGALTGPYRVVDARVVVALDIRPDWLKTEPGSLRVVMGHLGPDVLFTPKGLKPDAGDQNAWYPTDFYKGKELPWLTASVDDAIALVERVLPGWTIACVGQDDGKKWHAELRRGYQTSFSTVALAGAPLPALALVLAALKALQAQEADRG